MRIVKKIAISTERRICFTDYLKGVYQLGSKTLTKKDLKKTKEEIEEDYELIRQNFIAYILQELNEALYFFKEGDLTNGC